MTKKTISNSLLYSSLKKIIHQNLMPQNELKYMYSIGFKARVNRTKFYGI